MRAAKVGLHGLFAVYKPPGVSWKGVRDTVETKLLSELNSLERPPPRQQVRFLPGTVEGKDGKELTMTVTQLPVLAEHPLGKGPPPPIRTPKIPEILRNQTAVQWKLTWAYASLIQWDLFPVSGPLFTHLKVGAGHRLDKKSSGVLVLGVGHGNKLLEDVYNAHLIRTYTVRGLFGKATDDFSDTGKLIEKTTFDHITGEKLQRILAVIQGSSHKALLQYANIDLKTQEAFELAVKGLIRPMEKSPPLITAIRCLQFEPPDFQLEIHCMHETQQYLRKVVHEIGLELKSTAVCTQVRRVRDGAFTLDKALLRSQWTLHNIRNAILQCKQKVKTELQNTTAYEDIFAGSDQEREAGLSQAPGDCQPSKWAESSVTKLASGPTSMCEQEKKIETL